MSTEEISPQLDGFSDSSTVIGVDKTREEYLKLFSRATYSPQYDRPYSSPISGFYNAINTSTSLILLNHRFKYSHLREQVLPEELTNRSQKEFDYESIIVTEKPKRTPKRHSSHIPIDPYRHFESMGQTKYWHNRRCTSSSLVDTSTDICHTEAAIPIRSHTPHMKPRRSVSVNSRSQSAFAKKNKYYDDPQSFIESFCPYCCDMAEKSKLDLQQNSIKESSNQRIKSSGIRRKLPLTKGQQLYLIGKCQVYDIKDSKARRTNSYVQVLSNRLKEDFHYKPQFRLNDPRDYLKYAKFLRAPRSLTPNYSNKKTNIDSYKSFTLNNSKLRQESKPIQTFI